MALSFHNRIALITGASRGLGRALALELARRGAHILALSRTQKTLEHLDDTFRTEGLSSPTLIPCDVTDFSSFSRLSQILTDRWGRLDIFISNAAILGPIMPLAHIDPPQWNRVLMTNLSASWHLIRVLDPLLRRSSAGRALFITSSAGHRKDFLAYRGAYAVSKAGLEALARTYAAETISTSPIRVMLANPGPLRTNLRAQLMPGEDPSTLPLPEAAAEAFLDLCHETWEETGKLYDFRTQHVCTFQAPL